MSEWITVRSVERPWCAGMAEFAEAFEEDSAEEDEAKGKGEKEQGKKGGAAAAAAAATAKATAAPRPAASTSSVAQNTIRAKSAGGFYDPAFLRAVAPLYDLHMAGSL